VIRNSARVAIAAISVSLFLHVYGVGFSVRVPDEAAGREEAAETIILGTEFETFADTISEPVKPELAAEVPPDPEPMDIPSSNALVASPNPQATSSPGTGEARPVQPDTLSPTDTAQANESGRETQQAETAATTPDTSTMERAAEPAGVLDVAMASELEPGETVAALSAEPTPAVPVAPAPSPDAIPLAPAEADVLHSYTPEETFEAARSDPALSEDVLQPGGSPLAVKSSSRPPPRSERAATARAANEPPPILMTESPLVAYARSGSLAGWGRLEGVGGAGNAGVTNYAGRVLVHLNDAPRPNVANTSGNARVVFVINPDGSLASVSVVQSTGNFELDRAAIAQVRNAAPFPRPPDGASRQLSFVYRKR
jgi:protein TonB